MSMMSCSDLLFCTNRNRISIYGVDVSILDKYHHNIIFGKVNIRVQLLPVYIRQVCNYSQANVENIKSAIFNFNWSKAFENLSVDGKVKHLNKTLINIFLNYIPNAKIKCDYRQPPWITDNIKSSLKRRSKLIKIFYKKGLRKSDLIKVLEKSTECTKKILEVKKNYTLKMTTKLEHSNTVPKTYWEILNRLLYNKKTPAIPPLFIDSSFISPYYKKANLFNNFLLSICTPLKNNSVLPPLLYKTNIRIYSFYVTNKDILSIIKSLGSSNSHGYDNISIKMINICSDSVTIPLKILFEESLKKEYF